jgi:hypothetical protein
VNSWIQFRCKQNKKILCLHWDLNLNPWDFTHSFILIVNHHKDKDLSRVNSFPTVLWFSNFLLPPVQSQNKYVLLTRLLFHLKTILLFPMIIIFHPTKKYNKNKNSFSAWISCYKLIGNSTDVNISYANSNYYYITYSIISISIHICSVAH